MSRKRVIVTGASSGIGWATAQRFAAERWDVCVLARRETELDRLLDTLPAGKHLKLVGDYANPDTAVRLEELQWERWGRLCEYPAESSPLAANLTMETLAPDANGDLRIPDRPGLGMTVNPATLRRYLVPAEIRVRDRVLCQTPAPGWEWHGRNGDTARDRLCRAVDHQRVGRTGGWSYRRALPDRSLDLSNRRRAKPQRGRLILFNEMQPERMIGPFQTRVLYSVL
jgi:hypothetical protein